MTPVRSELPVAPRVPAPPPAPRAIEIEPRPPAREEDENEEVGRPEGPPGELPGRPYRGPREERRVDPYAWESRPEPLERTPERSQAPSEPGEPGEPAEEAPVHRGPEVMTRLEVEPESEPEPAEEPWVPGPPMEAEGEEPSADEEGGPRYPEVEQPPPPPAAPTWGRRSRRGR